MHICIEMSYRICTVPYTFAEKKHDFPQNPIFNIAVSDAPTDSVRQKTRGIFSTFYSYIHYLANHQRDSRSPPVYEFFSQFFFGGYFSLPLFQCFALFSLSTKHYLPYNNALSPLIRAYYIHVFIHRFAFILWGKDGTNNRADSPKKLEVSAVECNIK